MKHLAAICLLLILAVFLTACGGGVTNLQTPDNAPIDTPTASNQPATIPAVTLPGTFQEYALPQSDSGLMRPAIDHEGRIWFGEMGHNYLAVFDPRTDTFQQMVPPRGQSGVMGVQVAPDDTIWFAEQYANYIGHYFPATGHYQLYPLPDITTPDPSDSSKILTLPCAPNDIVLDANGNIWFAELNSDAIGKLNPRTGALQQYHISNPPTVQKLDPYGITIDPQGFIWFTEASTDHVGRLDPNTGKFTFFTMPGAVLPLMEIASDPHGTIWITSFSNGLLLSLNPHTGKFTPYYAPFTGNNAGGVYGLTISPNGEIWVTIPALNTIAQLDVAANHYVYYSIPTPSSLPLGLVMGANHTIWFTEAESSKIGMLKP